MSDRREKKSTILSLSNLSLLSLFSFSLLFSLCYLSLSLSNSPLKKQNLTFVTLTEEKACFVVEEEEKKETAR